MDRRFFLGGAAALMISLLPGCRTSSSGSSTRIDAGAGDAARSPSRLRARPGPPIPGSGPAGLQPLGLDAGRDGVVFVPPAVSSAQPRPLIRILHGAGGDGGGGLAPFLDLADDAGVILLAPDSRGRTWDAIRGGYGADVVFIDRALGQTFERYAVDPGQVGAAGFSDGASYALGVGRANGDLFSRVIAFSPGFSPPAGTKGGRGSSSPTGPATTSSPSTVAAGGSSPPSASAATTSATRSSRAATKCPPPSPPKPWPGSGTGPERSLPRASRRQSTVAYSSERVHPEHRCQSHFAPNTRGATATSPACLSCS